MSFMNSKRSKDSDAPAVVNGFGGDGGGAPFIRSKGLEISDAQYTKLSHLIYELCGITLGQGKRELLKARLMKRIRATGCRDIRHYMDRLKNDPDGQELIAFLDVITTNKTDFFREPQHFDYLIKNILPHLNKLCLGRDPLRIWSAACSTGEEPYTLAMVLMENRGNWAGRGASILASDLSTKVLGHGQRGVYSSDRVAPVPQDMIRKYFQRGVNRWAGHVRVRSELRNLVNFKRINLMDRFQFDPPFHVIFCRNVMIYFDKQTREDLVNKFFSTIIPGGYLFVGHSESLTGIKHPFSFVRPAVYRKEA
jgi:chemotaxis protein methyltransferase CheR